jgi:hypothetical protein
VLGHRRDEEVHRITDAGTPLSRDQDVRVRRYLWSMGIRTACFLGAVVAPSPWRWFLATAAIVLPYVAVVMANSGRGGGGDGLRVVDVRNNRRALDP